MINLFKTHSGPIKRMLPDDKARHTNKVIGFKMAEYSASSGLPIVECYKIYIKLFGECPYVLDQLSFLTKYHSNS